MSKNTNIRFSSGNLKVNLEPVMKLTEIDLAVPGTKGLKGDTGPQGEQGIPGPEGPEGKVGPIGKTGPPGPEGEKGAQGIQGPEGKRGLTGPIGETGKGEKGDTGPEGPPGPRGVPGVEGPRGLRGLQGEQGVPGPQGRPGNLVREDLAPLISSIDALNSEMEVKVDKEQKQWFQPTLLNGWKELNPKSKLAFRMDNFGNVHFRGVVKQDNPVIGELFIIPIKFRPAADVQRVVYTSITANQNAIVTISQSTGAVRVHGHTLHASFDGIFYTTEVME